MVGRGPGTCRVSFEISAIFLRFLFDLISILRQVELPITRDKLF